MASMIITGLEHWEMRTPVPQCFERFTDCYLGSNRLRLFSFPSSRLYFPRWYGSWWCVRTTQGPMPVRQEL